MMSVKANISIAIWLKRFAHHLNITFHLIVISANWVYSSTCHERTPSGPGKSVR